ncbi:YqhA family protein [Xanthobacter sp. TB0139]|uniref:YqhA family protein n=1 Tax=Xanthobacter sp. TB0139 TaxID=3459178 RepID=UPI004039EDBE
MVMGRWAMVPLFVGLLGALVLLMASFFIQLWNFATHVMVMSETAVIMKVLTLLDMALLGGLIVIVVSSGYENFVEKLDHDTAEDWPDWMAHISFAGLKLKLFATLMAITAIAMLKALMRLETNVSETQVQWLVVANLIFAICYAVLALADRFGPGRNEH